MGDAYQPMMTTFCHMRVEDYNWNYLDQHICGHSDFEELGEVGVGGVKPGGGRGVGCGRGGGGGMVTGKCVYTVIIVCVPVVTLIIIEINDFFFLILLLLISN